MKDKINLSMETSADGNFGTVYLNDEDGQIRNVGFIDLSKVLKDKSSEIRKKYSLIIDEFQESEKTNIKYSDNKMSEIGKNIKYIINVLEKISDTQDANNSLDKI